MENIWVNLTRYWKSNRGRILAPPVTQLFRSNDSIFSFSVWQCDILSPPQVASIFRRMLQTIGSFFSFCHHLTLKLPCLSFYSFSKQELYRKFFPSMPGKIGVVKSRFSNTKIWWIYAFKCLKNQRRSSWNTIAKLLFTMFPLIFV